GASSDCEWHRRTAWRWRPAEYTEAARIALATMIDKQEAAASEFKHRDAASYDDVTDAFDRFTERFTGSIAERVVALAAPGPDESLLDVGCGTGVVSFAAARRLSGRGRLVGIDLSDGMLRSAREKATRSGMGAKVEFRKMDAEALEFPDA